MKYSKIITQYEKYAESSGNELAYITHFMQNHGYFSVRFYEKLAKKYLNGSNGKSKHHGTEEECEHPYTVLFPVKWDIPYPPPRNPSFTFIDLFAGIGGFRIAFQNTGGKCVFSCEKDEFAKKTYERNFGEMPFGDIRDFTAPEITDRELNQRIPDHDVLTAGFPCQPFSLAGVSKKNSLGHKHGFDDPTQGTLFFDIKRILQVKKPSVFFLENVKNLIHHDEGRTFNIIKTTLSNLGYVFDYKVVDAAKWVPQHRERIFIIGYNPEKINASDLQIIIPEKPASSYRYRTLNDILQANVPAKYTLGPGTWSTLERHRAHHAQNGNGFGYGIHRLPVAKNTVTRTISARYHKDGAEILIRQQRRRPRRLTVEEAMQLQGFNPDRYVFPVSQTQAYRQIGNSVAIPAIQATALEIKKILLKNR
ncbi:MAG: DNA (cytosine-5-)-methyltransferase [Endomicrobiales bacterium]|nr:DNA (cytosine-5-)-methyltransferase [Endomicrobiales bacterium]